MKNRSKLVLLLCISLVLGGLTGCGDIKSKEMNMNQSDSMELTESCNDMDKSMDTSMNMKTDICEQNTIERNSNEDEEYSEIVDNKFIRTSDNAISTFAADVDTASYSNIRRMIDDGYKLDEIPKDAVRIEEMVNYFSYEHKEPKKGEPFGVTMELADCPWNEDNKVAMIRLDTEKVDFSEAPDSNLVFLLDVSGSMSDENKLPLLVKSFSMLSEELSEKDKVSIVTYAGDDKVVLSGVSGDNKGKIIDALENLESNGSTNGSAGIETAYELAEEYFIEGGNNRVILATDGDLNVGITSEDELEKLISKKKETGVFLSTIGFGMGNYKDNKMETLADKGNGNYAYIDSINEAKKVMVEEMGANFVTVAKDVKLQVEFNNDVIDEYRLIGYENRILDNEDYEDDSKDAGEIGAGHSVAALYELKIKDNTKSDSDKFMSLGIRYKAPESDTSKELKYEANNNNYTVSSSDDMNWAMAVAEFGMLLRNSEYKGDASFKNVLELARKTDIDRDEYKEEFVELVEKVMD